MHITDANGDGILLEATPDGGYAVYDTRECAGVESAGVGSCRGRVPVRHGTSHADVLRLPRRSRAD